MIGVHSIQQKADGDWVCLSGQLKHAAAGDWPEELWFRFPLSCAAWLTRTADPFLPAVLIPAMITAQPIEIRGTVSRRLLDGAARLMQIYRRWYPGLREVPISADRIYDEVDCPDAAGSRAMMFFSGGVDSFYTYLKNRRQQHKDPSKKITHFLFVHGLDIPLENDDLDKRVFQSISRIADCYGTVLVAVSTNIREMIRRTCTWQTFHGSALASIALCLEAGFSTCRIAGDHTQDHDFPRGTHPQTDPLWSTDRLTLIHDGCEAGRIEKVLFISNDETAMQYLRVCWENSDSLYNCGRCEKCIRTKLNLIAAGVSGKCTTLDDFIDVKKIRAIRTAGDLHVQFFMRENYEALARIAPNAEITQALRAALSPWTAPNRTKQVKQWKRYVRDRILQVFRR